MQHLHAPQPRLWVRSNIVAHSFCLFHLPFFVTPDKPPVVQPETESLEDFTAREAERLLTAEERIKLIAVTEMILGQHFTRPSAIEEEFRLQRRLAGINSPAFNAFADKWAAKVEKMHLEDSVETMREIYRSLLRGLQVRELCKEESGTAMPVSLIQEGGAGSRCGLWNNWNGISIIRAMVRCDHVGWAWIPNAL